MDKLTHEEKRVYFDEIDSKAAVKDFEFLRIADEVIDDMNTPLGRQIMTYLFIERKKAGLALEKSIYSDSPVTETERIEYKQLNMLVTRLEELVTDREVVTLRIRDKLKVYLGLDKAN